VITAHFHVFIVSSMFHLVSGFGQTDHTVRSVAETNHFLFVKRDGQEDQRALLPF